MIAPHRRPHLLFAASALLASLQPLTGCAAPDPPLDEALRSAFPDQAAAVLSVGPGFLRSGGGRLERAAAGRRGGVAARLPSDGGDAIVFELDGGATVRAREVGAEGEAMLADRAVAYRRAGGSSFWTATPAGVEEWLLLDAAAVQRAAPVAAWEVQGGALAERDGAIEIADAAGAVRLRVTAPAAYAAGGREVGARLAARGARIELFVDAEGEQVLVDPEWESPAPPAMGTRRTRHAAAPLGTGVLVTGGTSLAGTSLASTELYDPAEGAWSSSSPAPGAMRRARTEHAAIALDSNRVLVVGGDSSGANSTYEVYDALAMEWVMGGVIPLRSPSDQPVPLYHHTATRLAGASGEVLIVGGQGDLDHVVVFSNVFRYDPSTGELTEAAPLLEPRTLHTATLLDSGEVLVVGGYHNTGLRTTELYDPMADAWRPGPSMSEGAERYLHTATRLQDGRVLMIGYTSVPDIYNPVTETFSAGARMINDSSRFGHSATLLPNGCVLVAGGRLSSSHSSDAELYNPDENEWIVTAPLSAPRAFHEATYLDEDGSVMLTGGDNQSQKLATVERFTLGQPGEACADRCECQSGFCVDGVCCDAACDLGACDACSVAAGASADGTCSLLTGTACNDDNPCTSGDACNAGACVGTNDDTAACGGDEPCTRYACVGGSCVATDDDDAPCDDDNSCTTDDICRAGTCAGEAITCAATDGCHEDGTCDPETGKCVPQSKADNAPCEDGGVCIAGGCVHPSQASSSSSQGGAGAGEAMGPAEDAGGGGAGPETDDEGGCGCRAAGAAAPGGSAAAALLMAAAAWRASRRRRRRCPSTPRWATPR
ncbi:kelch repeat-containing protein [Sorangium sp. So ce1151]|uniref:kelch repeat-containing protein n=1 Tax=Sorangium sp. So ce1151 TaxID=3133332 RepID=UPI003F63F6F7